jgi:luciferase family oxidoreductase group 1
MPNDTPLPPIWLLGSSDYSAQLAGQIGAGFAFAHHFSNHDAVSALLDYRRQFAPSPFRQAPWAMLGIAAIVAPTDEEADRLATTQDLFRLRRDRGEFAPLPSPEEAAAYSYSAAERHRVEENRERLFVGSPATVMERLQPLIDRCQADEVMAVTAIYDHEARKRSYTLLAGAFGLKAKASQAAE